MDVEPAVRVRYDAEANAAYIYLRSPLVATPYVAETVPVDSSINLDFDDDGRLVGVEVLPARTLLRPEVLGER